MYKHFYKRAHVLRYDHGFQLRIPPIDAECAFCISEKPLTRTAVIKHLLRALVLLLLVFASQAFSGPLYAKPASEIFAQASKSVVVVYNYDNKGIRQQLGSGVVMPDGQVATNFHVVNRATKITVLFNGKEFAAKASHSNPERDICLLDVEGLSAPCVVVGHASQLKVGEKVYAIGAPDGFEKTLSDGIVSGFRAVDGGRYIQTTTPISPGSSGGGLFDEEGRLVGLPTFYMASGQSLNFAVPVEWVLETSEHQVAGAGNTRQCSEWLAKTVAYEKNRDWAGMVRQCNLWVKAQPKNCDAWYCSGIAYNKIGDSHSAISALQTAVQLKPNYSKAWNDLGFAYVVAGMRLEAIEAYKKAILTNQNNASAWHNIGILYLKKGDLEMAVESFQQAVQIKPDYLSAWVNLGIALKTKGTAKEAIQAFTKAISINSNNSVIWNNLGLAYRDAGDINQSIDAFRHALQINPNYDIARNNLAETYRLTGRTGESINTCIEATKANPNNPAAWQNLGDAYSKSNQKDKALEAYKEALRCDPNNVQALLSLGKHYASEKNRQVAMDVYRRLKNIDNGAAKNYLQNYLL